MKAPEAQYRSLGPFAPTSINRSAKGGACACACDCRSLGSIDTRAAQGERHPLNLHLQPFATFPAQDAIMIQLFRRRSEPDALYVELVAALFTVVVPSSIMAATFLAVGVYTAIVTGGVAAWVVTALGLIPSVAKLISLAAHQLLSAEQRREPSEAARWERRFAWCSWSFSVAVSALAAMTFASSAPVPQMLATGMLFGYCSGVVARGSVRPAMAFVSLSLATVPVIVAAAGHGGVGHVMLATMFAAFLLGSFESVRHAYAASTQQITLREKMASIARRDVLTGLANRLGLREAFDELMKRGDQVVAVHCLDLDRFKPINDMYGHPAGDAVLRQLAGRLQAALRPRDIAARVGGDEFVIVQSGLGHNSEAELFARRLCRIITGTCYDAKGHSIEIGVSIGYSSSSTGDCSLDGLLASADGALYRVKASGGGVQALSRASG